MTGDEMEKVIMTLSGNMKLGTTETIGMIFFARSKPVGEQRWSGIGEKKILKRFVYSLPVVRNPIALFHVFVQSDAFYLPHILSLIELHDSINLLCEIGTVDKDEIIVSDNADEIEKFRCGLLHQGEDLIAGI